MLIFTSAYLLLSIISKVHTEDNGNITCPPKWIDGVDIQISCFINETSLTACPRGATYFVDFTFQKKGSVNAPTQCTVNAINVNCNNVLISKGCGCQQHSGGYYVINYKVTANETSHSGGSWKCEADCLKFTSNSCSNITFDLPEKVGSCPTWCIIVIVVVTLCGLFILIVITVIVYKQAIRRQWRCVCICYNASTPNGMHRGQCCLCCCLIPNTNPIQDNSQPLQQRNGSSASPQEK